MTDETSDRPELPAAARKAPFVREASLTWWEGKSLREQMEASAAVDVMLGIGWSTGLFNANWMQPGSSRMAGHRLA